MLSIDRLAMIRKAVLVENPHRYLEDTNHAVSVYHGMAEELLAEVDQLRSENAAPPATIPIHITPTKTDKYLVGHRGHCEIIWWFDPDGNWYPNTKLGWHKDPASFRATWYAPIPTDD